MMRAQVFDVDVVRTCDMKPGAGTRSILGSNHESAPWKNLGFVGAKLSFDDARRFAEMLDAAGGAAFVVPAAYRTPMVSVATAKNTAENHLEKLKAEQGDVFAPLEEGQAQSMWWRFYAMHLPSLREGREPGCIYVDVDKIDGHVVAQEEKVEFARWQRRGAAPT